MQCSTCLKSMFCFKYCLIFVRSEQCFQNPHCALLAIGFKCKTMSALPSWLKHDEVCRSPDEMRMKLSVQFQGEEGIDAGGVSREWYQVTGMYSWLPAFFFKWLARQALCVLLISSKLLAVWTMFLQYSGFIPAKAATSHISTCSSIRNRRCPLSAQ